jgi:hypothetical protein
MFRKIRISELSKPLAFLIIIGVFLLVIFSYESLSISTSADRTFVSMTTTNLVPNPLSYTAYQIQMPGEGAITLSYSFPQNSGWGTLNMTSVWGSLTDVGNTTSYLSCFFTNSTSGGFGDATFVGAGGNSSSSVNDCGVYISSVNPEIAYSPNLYTTQTFTITVLGNATTGVYLFFPPGAPCGFSVFLIVGLKVPSELPMTENNGCSGVSDPGANISVVGVNDLTGFNIP